jgi:pimeloyl-ACP methyl ester carboxylesterase
MPKIDAGGISLHYIATGHGADVVMLHGFLGNLAVWHLEIAPQLRTAFRLTTYDLRGHGYSQVTPDGYTTADMAQDLRHLLDGLGIEKPHLVGHSFGADVCLHFALHHPERVDRIVAIEPGLAALVHQRKREDWEGWSYWVSKLEAAGLPVPPDKRSNLEYLLNMTLETTKVFGPARGLPRNREPLLRLLRETTLMRDYEDPRDLTLDAVARIAAPTLLVYGDRSHFLGSYDVLKVTLPNCTPVLVPGGEHFGPLERAVDMVQLIREFLAPAAKEPEKAEVGGGGSRRGAGWVEAS